MCACQRVQVPVLVPQFLRSCSWLCSTQSPPWSDQPWPDQLRICNGGGIMLMVFEVGIFYCQPSVYFVVCLFYLQGNCLSRPYIVVTSDNICSDSRNGASRCQAQGLGKKRCDDCTHLLKFINARFRWAGATRIQSSRLNLWLLNSLHWPLLFLGQDSLTSGGKIDLNRLRFDTKHHSSLSDC